jgi:GNAT superfamily N-acetyltransferase
MSADFAIRAVTGERLADVADLFTTNGTTRGCWCMYHIATAEEYRRGYGAGNRAAFESLADEGNEPLGLLAYRDGVPVGWVAAGPRRRYARAIGPRSKILAERDSAEDDDVWLVPCFFTRGGHRRQGVTSALLAAAVELAARHGATAVEGFPRSSGQKFSADDYLGREDVFAACGFDCVTRPTPRRVVMRRDLTARSRRSP